LALALCAQPISVDAAQSRKMSPLNAQQIASLLQKQGIAKEKIPTMTAIALAESGGRTQAYNPTGLDRSYGLFQVNMYGGLGPARMKQFGLKKEQDLFNPETNVKAAKQILGSQGLGAWSVYKSGKYKQFLPEAQKATATLGSEQPQQTPQPQPTAARGGRTFVIFGDEDVAPGSKDFLEDYAQRLIAGGQVPIQTGIDPVGMLTKAMFQTPNYLGAEM
jgi:hypothetical protein